MTPSDSATKSWLDHLPQGMRPYLEAGPLASLFLGMSSGFPYAMLGATLTTRLAQDNIEKSTITAFALVFLAYNFKWLWAWIIDGITLPIIGRLGHRVSWMIVLGLAVMAATVNLALVDPNDGVQGVVTAAIILGIAGATFDIIIDAYRIEILEPRQLGAGSGMVQYGWRIGSAGAGAIALVIAARAGWEVAYMACALIALPAMLTALFMGEPKRHKEIAPEGGGVAKVLSAAWKPFAEFMARQGAFLALAFILLHKIGDTLANLTFRLLFEDLGFTNDEIAIYDVGVGFWAYLIGIFIGGWMYSKMGMKKSVLVCLILMAVSNFSFAALAAVGHSNIGMAAAIGFENMASGAGGVCVVAYFSALCDLRFTAAQYALISAAASIVGRVLTGTTAGTLIDAMGYVNFYLLTTAIAFPGIILFWIMIQKGWIDSSIGSAGKEGEGDVRAENPTD